MNGRFPKQIFLLFLLILGSLGCGGASNTSGPTPTADPAAAMQAAIQATMAAEAGNRGEQIAVWLAELDEAEARWTANPVENYEIEILYVDGSRQVIQLHTVTVANGVVAAEDVRCSDQAPNCVLKEIPAERLTIPGLFQTARAALENDEINQFSGGFHFHEAYSFPQTINLRPPGAANPQAWYWEVESFTVTE